VTETVNLPDTPALPGPAASWAPGESMSGMPGADATRAKVTGELADVQREKVAAQDKVFGQIDDIQNKMLPRIEQLSKDAGVEAEKMKPWDADAESAKRSTDPIASFGSLASVAGILASAFTNAPMENALNASAAAMNAIRAGDDKSYDRAHKAWQDNQKMYMDRHKIQHTAYQDAVSLLNVNMQAANTKLQVLAARFGDKQVQTLLEAGMSKEVEEVIAARQKNAMALEKEYPRIVEENAKISRLFALGYETKNPTSEKSQKALVQFQTEQAELKRKSSAFGSGGAANLTTDRQRAQDVANYRQQLRSEENEDGTPKYKPEEVAQKAAEYEKSLKMASAAPSGNRMDELSGKINRVEMAESTIDKVEELLKKHKAIAGLGGTVTRPAEVIGNIFGSNETDRAQFKRYISELQEWAPRILTDSNGRPLSAEAGKVANIIAGLNLGDTVANTSRAYAELRPLLKKIKTDLGVRRGAPAAPGEKPAKQPSWMDAPEVK